MALIEDDKQWISERLDHARDETIAASREMQTEVIRYIGNIAEPFNVRMRHLEHPPTA